MSETTKKATIFQAIKFALFSTSAGIIQIGSFTLMKYLVPAIPFIKTYLDSHESFAKLLENDTYGPLYLIALILSVLWNFTFNRKFTFKSAANVKVAMLKIFGFYLVFAPVSTIIGSYITGFDRENDILGFAVLGVTMLCNMITEYLFCKFVVYRNQENTAVKSKPKKR